VTYRAIAVRLEIALEFALGLKDEEYRSFKIEPGELLLCSSSTPKTKGFALALTNVVATESRSDDRGNYIAWKLDELRFVQPFEVKCGQRIFYVEHDLDFLEDKPELSAKEKEQVDSLALTVEADYNRKEAYFLAIENQILPFFEAHGENPDALFESNQERFHEIINEFHDSQRSSGVKTPKLKRDAVWDLKRIMETHKIVSFIESGEKAAVALQTLLKSQSVDLSTYKPPVDYYEPLHMPPIPVADRPTEKYETLIIEPNEIRVNNDNLMSSSEIIATTPGISDQSPAVPELVTTQEVKVMAESLNAVLNQAFAGKIVRKDLTKKIKEGANVPVYVLEYLLGMYCATDDEASIEEGVNRVKTILADNFVRPDEAEKIKSKMRELGSYTVIDKVEAKLDPKLDIYLAVFSNLNIRDVIVDDKYIKDYEKLLAGGIWCVIRMNYNKADERIDKGGPFEIEELTPIQMPNMDMDELFDGRKQFTKDEWIDVLLRSTGMEPTQLENRLKWHLLLRMVPLVENNFNLCELGPRGTGKSHIYKEISPNSILISGGQTTVANLFYNMGNRTIGLVGIWDCVAFDEVAGITFKDKDGVQIMKDFMASGSFARGKEEKNANASMVFVGNINQSIDVVMKTSHLFEPFPDAMSHDAAFFDRMHYYLPGWEIPKMRPEYFTNEFGFITDYLAEFMREMRKRSFGDAIDKYFRLGSHLNQRDTIAVRKTVSGLLKLLYPNGVYERDDVEEVVRYALEGRRRVKEQLKKIGGMEFYDVHFSYLDNESFEEHFVPVPEQGSGKLIPEGQGKPGHVYTVQRGDTGMLGVYKMETEMVSGNGKFETTGNGAGREGRENLKTAQNYFKANKKQISNSIRMDNSNYLMHITDSQGVGSASEVALCSLVALCSAALRKPVQSQMCILGNMSIGGTISKVEELANSLQVCLDAGARKVLLPMSSAVDIGTVPGDLFTKFQTSFYGSPEEAVFKALGVE